MPKQIIKKICPIITLLYDNKTAMDKLSHSAWIYDRTLKMARSIANLAGKDNAQTEFQPEAMQCRSFNHENKVGYWSLIAALPFRLIFMSLK